MRDGWVETPIGDVAQVLSGFAFKSELFNKTEGIPLIRIRDLPKRDLTEALYSGSYEDRYVVKKGDFLIGMDGEFHCYEWNGPDALLNQRVCRIQDFKLAIVIPRYIYFAVNQYLDKIEQDTGYTTVKHISAKQVLGITIPLPPLPEQKRIVDLISSVDSYLESLRIALAKSISARKSSLESQLDSFKNTSPVFRLEELCATGKSAIVDGPFGANLKREDYLEEGIPVLKIQNIKQDYVVIKKMDYVNEDKYQELRRHSFQQGDIVMTKLGDPLGLSAIVRELDKGLIVADLVRIRPDKIDVEFLCMQLNSAKIQNYINRMQKGSTRPRVNLGMIREMPIAVPNETKINEFVAVFGAWSEQNRKMEETIHATEQLRSGLLSDLLSGNHKIPTSYDNVIGAA
jgi:type I restriction enzyme S subunit